MKRPCLLIFGLGYTANALVDYLRDKNWEVWGTTRSALTADLLRKKNINALLWSDESEIKSSINRSDYILHSIAPTEVGDPVYEKFAEQIISRSKHFRGLDTSLQLAFTVITTEIGSMKKHQLIHQTTEGV